MSKSKRKPWQEPVVYEDDRWPDKPSRRLDDEVGGTIRPDPDLVRQCNDQSPTRKRPVPDVPRSPTRPAADQGGSRWRQGEFASNDTEPLNYGKGPHDREFGLNNEDETAYETDYDD